MKKGLFITFLAIATFVMLPFASIAAMKALTITELASVSGQSGIDIAFDVQATTGYMDYAGYMPYTGDGAYLSDSTYNAFQHALEKVGDRFGFQNFTTLLIQHYNKLYIKINSLVQSYQN